MADDKSKTKEDRKLVAAKEPYELADFAKKHGITADAAGKILADHGPSRSACDAAARKMKSGR